MQEQPELVGLPAVTGGAVRLGIELVLLDQVLHIAASAIGFFVKIFATPRQVGDNKTHICSQRSRFDASDDLALFRPAFRAILRLEKTPLFFFRLT